MFNKSKLELIYLRPFMVLTNSPIDSNNPLLKFYWFILENALALINPLGHLFGAILYPIDKLLIALLKEGPTSEIVILKKVTLNNSAAINVRR